MSKLNEDLIWRQFTDERLLKIEKRLDGVSSTVTQYGSAVDSLTGDLQKLQANIKDALNEATENIVKASKVYIDERVGVPANSASGASTVATLAQSQKGGLEAVFDRISQPGGPVDRIANGISDRIANIDLPLIGRTSSGSAGSPIQSELVNLERQLSNATTMLYRNQLKEVVTKVNKQLGLPAVAEAVKVTHTP